MHPEQSRETLMQNARTLHIYKVGVQQANLLDEKANPYFLTYTYSTRKWEKQSAQRIIIACRYLNREICSMQYGAVTIFLNIHLRCIFLAFYEFHLAMPSPSETVGDECIQQLEPSSPAVTLCDALQQHERWKRSGGLSPSSNTKISSCFDSSSLMAWTKTSSLWCHIGLRVSKEEREYLVFFVVEIFQRCRYVNHMSLIELANHFYVLYVSNNKRCMWPLNLHSKLNKKLIADQISFMVQVYMVYVM